MLFMQLSLFAQMDSIWSKLDFEMDYRFRVEQDWDSRKSDGSFRDDRSRMRYRFRTGLKYCHDNYQFGFRIRTGDPRKQQDPQLTLGQGLKEFGTLPIGFEKVYFKYYTEKLNFWIGKNTFPFEKSNELFWSDNVFPEGVWLQKNWNLSTTWINQFALSGGHFILSSNGQDLWNDGLMQGVQASFRIFNKKLSFFPGLFLFRNIDDIPDGAASFQLNYSILHFGTRWKLIENLPLKMELDFYSNMEDYNTKSQIPEAWKNERNGFVLGLTYGQLDEKGDWKFKATYANLERYAILDYMAQNDWARWDYSNYNSPDGRLSNLEGIELVGAYAINKKLNIVCKYYFVDQLKAIGVFRENGQRIRFDINAKI